MTHRDGLPRLSDGVAHALRCPASPQRTLLAENLGKPSLWVMISAPWYYASVGCSLVWRACPMNACLGAGWLRGQGRGPGKTLTDRGSAA